MSEHAARARPVPPLLLGMILFVASELMFFGGLFAAYLSLRSGVPEWPPPGTGEADPVVGAALTALLLASSATQHAAAGAAAGRDRRGTIRWLAVTLALGVAFVAGQMWEAANLPFGVDANAFGSAFGTITGFHALHVVIGLGMLVLALSQVRRNAATGGLVEAVTLYWHFVDAVWLAVFVTLYLLVG